MPTLVPGAGDWTAFGAEVAGLRGLVYPSFGIDQVIAGAADWATVDVIVADLGQIIPDEESP